jgi:Holliday junction DNA helicase RuvA
MLYTYMQVKEDSVSLFGFLNAEDKQFFELLIGITGVGPKAALALLSVLSPSQFGLAVLTEDFKALTRAQGVGAKLAQKIIFELRDKMKKELSAAGDAKGNLADISGLGGPGGVDFVERGKYGEAVEALIVLGCTAVEANGVVSRVFDDGLALEEIIRKALKEMDR